ncbi:MAG: hypothetical protein WA063_04310, partial [Minisyncoccia bacterium]
MNKVKLIISDSETNADMFYATETVIGDDFIYLEKDDEKILYIDSLYFNQAKKEAEVDKVINYLKYDEKANRNNLQKVMSFIIKENKIESVIVPENLKIKLISTPQGINPAGRCLVQKYNRTAIHPCVSLRTTQGIL